LPNPGDNIIQLQYDNVTQALYALHWNHIDSMEYLVSINPATGAMTIIDSIPGVQYICSMPNYNTFDETNHRYVFQGGDATGHTRLYSVNVLTGNVDYSPSFPVLPNPGDNVIELEYDNASAILYALNWDTKALIVTGVDENAATTGDFRISPNPFYNALTIDLDRSYDDIMIFIYNSAGQVVRKETASNAMSVNIERGNLDSGLYFISVVCDHVQIGLKTIVAE
jgi:hypothetical protein